MAIHVTREDIIKIMGAKNPKDLKIKPSFIGQVCINLTTKEYFVAYALDYESWEPIYKKIKDDEDIFDLNITADKVAYRTDSDANIFSVKDALDKLLYNELLATNFSCESGSTYEIGQVLSSLKFNWAYNKTNIVSQSILYRENGIDREEPIGKDERSYIYNSAISRDATFKLKASDGVKTITKFLDIRFLNKGYWGVSKSPENFDSDFVKSLQNSKLVSNRVMDITVTALDDEYIYVALPKSLVDKITFSSGGFEGGFKQVGGDSVTVINAHNPNITAEYCIYQSDNPGLGKTTINIR